MTHTMEPDRRKRFFASATLVTWVAIILVLGSSTGSMAQTSRIIKPLIEFFFPSAPPETFLLVHAAIRKTAHFVEYAILAILAARAFRRSAADVVRSKWPIWALLMVAAVAAVDEFVQSFNVARTGSPFDALLDLAGGIVGLCLFAVFHRLSTRSGSTQ